MKLFFIMILCLGLSACNSQVQIVTKITSNRPPPGLTDCQLTGLPSEFRSRKDVANFLAEAYTNNKICYQEQQFLKQYFDAQQKIIK